MTDHADTMSSSTLASFAAGDKSHAFRAASRHSSRVRALRLLTVGGAAALVGGIVLFTLFDPFHAGIAGATIEGASLDGTKVTMAHPRLSGYRKDGRPYVITASAAVQDVKAPTLFELHDIKADLTMEDQTVTSVTSATGLYNSTGDVMNLTSPVRIVGASGLDVHAQDAQVEFKSSSVVTTKPVTVAMHNSTVDADGMRVVDGGRQVTFEGHVHSVMRPAETVAAADGPTRAP